MVFITVVLSELVLKYLNSPPPLFFFPVIKRAVSFYFVKRLEGFD